MANCGVNEDRNCKALTAEPGAGRRGATEDLPGRLRSRLLVILTVVWNGSTNARIRH